jgi:hypothetical protein
MREMTEQVKPELVARVVAGLGTKPKSVPEARRPANAGGVPDAPGFYAWWARSTVLGRAEGREHPLDATLRALYVGVAPSGPGTAQRLYGRVVGNHIAGNTGGSTFRLALAALLLEEHGYQPTASIGPKGRTKYILPPDQEEDLRGWQTEHLRVTWIEIERPWQDGLEGAVIGRLRPPLNSADNSGHEFS